MVVRPYLPFNWGIFKGMIKYLFIFFNSLSLFIFGLFSGDNDIKVTSTIPSNLAVGKETAVEIKITKGELSGFGRLQLQLPEGITVKGAEEKDAEYSFEENTAKWIWASLPPEADFTIKLTLVASETAVGDKEISARFSYVFNNEKAFTDMEVAKVSVTASGDVAKVTEPLPAKSGDSLANNTAQVSNVEPPGNIVVERKVSRGENDREYVVVVKIKKGTTKGFARYSDDAHENLSAKALKTDGSSFSIADGKIKFVWVNVPDKEDLEVSYSLSGNPDKTIILAGEYSYLEDNQSKKVKLNADTLNFNAPTPAKENSVKPAEELANAGPEKKAEEPKPEGQKEEEKTAPAVKTKNEGNASFQVQIGAFSNGNVSAARLKSKFNISENIKSELHGGFSKFMVGTHKEYKKAREHRETMVSVNGVKSAFVVAYNGGKRISVQEALMVTNQRWFK